MNTARHSLRGDGVVECPRSRRPSLIGSAVEIATRGVSAVAPAQPFSIYSAYSARRSRRIANLRRMSAIPIYAGTRRRAPSSYFQHRRWRMAVASDLYEPRALARKSWVDDKNFAGVRRIRSVISGWEIERAVNAHSPETDPRENAERCNDLCDAVNAEVNAAIAAAGEPLRRLRAVLYPSPDVPTGEAQRLGLLRFRPLESASSGCSWRSATGIRRRRIGKAAKTGRALGWVFVP